MAIYRGDGTPTAGDILYDQADLDAAVAAAAASEAAAATSETNAATSETNAAASAAAASTSETNAATSASNSATSASASAASASAAATSETNAAASEAAAAASFIAIDEKYLGSKTSDPTLNNQGGALADGALYFNTVNNVIRVYDLGTTSWADIGKATANITEWTVTGTQTVFSGLDDNSLILSYTPGYLLVYQNGILLDPNDYTASDGTSVTLGTAAQAGDTVNMVGFGTFDVSTSYTKTESDAKYGILTAANTWSGVNKFSAVVQATGYTTPSSGAGVEVGYTGGVGYLTAYDRGTPAWKPLAVRGETVQFHTASGEEARVWNDAGVSVLQVKGAGIARLVAESALGSSSNIQIRENNTHKFLLGWDATNHWATLTRYRDSDQATLGQMWFYDNGNVTLTTNNSSGISLKLDPTASTLTSTAPTVSLEPPASNNFGLELGQRGGGSATTTFIDFHSGATGVDYDCRISTSGGTGSSGGAALSITTSAGYYLNAERQDDYAFRGSSAGGFDSSTGPSGWSHSRTSAGLYRVTHNFGTTAYVPVVVSYANGGVVRIPEVVTITTTYFDVQFRDAAGAAQDSYHTCIVRMK